MSLTKTVSWIWNKVHMIIYYGTVFKEKNKKMNLDLTPYCKDWLWRYNTYEEAQVTKFEYLLLYYKEISWLINKFFTKHILRWTLANLVIDLKLVFVL